MAEEESPIEKLNPKKRVFVEEYLLGKINGFAPKLIYNATEFIKNNPVELDFKEEIYTPKNTFETFGFTILISC